MNKTAFIFPGQGAQKCGMGKDFYENSELAKEIFDTATAELGLDMTKLCSVGVKAFKISKMRGVCIIE